MGRDVVAASLLRITGLYASRKPAMATLLLMDSATSYQIPHQNTKVSPSCETTTLEQAPVSGHVPAECPPSSGILALDK
jgi:hypothetical protein